MLVMLRVLGVGCGKAHLCHLYYVELFSRPPRIGTLQRSCRRAVRPASQRDGAVASANALAGGSLARANFFFASAVQRSKSAFGIASTAIGM